MKEVNETNVKKEVISWVKTLAITIVVVLIINNGIIVNANIPSSSMASTINTGDRLIANRLAYLFAEPSRGDIIIFYCPDEPEQMYVKRLIGMPGDEVIVGDNQVMINGEVMDEPYINEATRGDFGPYQVPEGHYFVMGDNRNNSEDSRAWDNTFLDEEDIIGQVLLRYYPTPQRIK